MLHHLLAALDGPSDSDLLARFATDRDAAAFELLVWRHAGLVLRICRAALRNYHTAEDAAQATFLALARQAESVRGSNVPGWLFRVARRVAARAARRQGKHSPVPDIDLDQLPSPEREHDPERDRVLHEEVARLPREHQLPVLLCFFEGLTHAEASRRLGWPVGTVAGRVARAKEVLARRLTRRGVTPAVLIVTATAIPPSFAGSTTRLAVSFAARDPKGVSGAVLELANREVGTMVTRKILRVGGILAAAGTLALGVVWAAEPPPGPPTNAGAEPATPPPPAPAAQPRKPVVEKTFAVAPITTDLQRRLVRDGGQHSLALVLVDGSAMFRGPKELDLDALPLKPVYDALAAYKPDKDRSRVHFQVQYGFAEANKNGRWLLRCGLDGLGRQCGFAWSNATDTYRNADFSMAEFLAPLKDEKGADATEPRVGDDRVHAYPVRTPLSRVLTDGADGLVDVRVRLDHDADDWVPADVEKSAQAALAGLKLPKGKKVNFLLNIRRDDNKRPDRVLGLVRRWASDHGLEFGSCSY